jgi:hypothetical protein
MAYFDHQEANRNKECREAYDSMKVDLYQTNKLAYEFLEKMEKRQEENEKELAEHRNFFSLLRKLLPRQRSIHDKIG